MASHATLRTARRGLGLMHQMRSSWTLSDDSYATVVESIYLYGVRKTSSASASHVLYDNRSGAVVYALCDWCADGLYTNLLWHLMLCRSLQIPSHSIPRTLRQ